MENEEINDTINNPAQQNQDNYDDLLVSIEAGQGQLNLLIAVADDPALRQKIIDEYEAELQPTIRAYRVELTREEPSLRAAVASVVETDEYLRQGGAAVVTVTGAEKLLFLKFGDGSEDTKSQQEKFFGYLQWTREALRQFPFSIVLWVTSPIEQELSKKAPDFWSWRKGVFRFQSPRKGAISGQETSRILPLLENSLAVDPDSSDDFILSLADLQQLITQTEQQWGLKDPSLSSLYASMGKIYHYRMQRPECQDYVKEQALAIEYFQKAISLQTELGQELELADSLNNLALVYCFANRYEEAERLFLQALDMRKRLLGENHLLVAKSMSFLAMFYTVQERYQEAERLFLQALDMRMRLLGEDHLLVARSLNNLGMFYTLQERYAEAEPLLRQALEMRNHLLGDNHSDVATCLSFLAMLCYSQGRYGEAESMLQQALEMRKRLLEENNPLVAISLNNLAMVYETQERYAEAEALLQQAFELFNHRLGENHPNTVTCRKNLAQLLPKLQDKKRG